MKKNGCVLWFSGLSGAGKSTISHQAKLLMERQGVPTIILDGDVLRSGLCSDLGFSRADRSENLRRVSELASLLAKNGQCVICALISPFEKERTRAKDIIGKEYFHNIYIKADVETCIGRDPKGLYKKALAGEIKQFTGISDTFEEPTSPDLVIDTRMQTLEESTNTLRQYVAEKVGQTESVV
jgi:adenylyl-sulfate kinase